MEKAKLNLTFEDEVVVEFKRELDQSFKTTISLVYEVLVSSDENDCVMMFEKEGKVSMIGVDYGQSYLESNPSSEFICFLTTSDCKKGINYVTNYVKDNFYKVTSSKGYAIKHQLIDLLSIDWAGVEYKVDVINDFLYLNNNKLCNINYVKYISTYHSSIFLYLIDESKVCIGITPYDEYVINEIHIECEKRPVEDCESYDFIEYEDGTTIYTKTIYELD